MKIKCPHCGSENWVFNGHSYIKKSKTKYQRFRCLNCGKEFNEKGLLKQFPELDLEMLVENIKLAKQKQRFQDLNRIERKAFRENARLENAVVEYNKKLIEVLEKYNLAKFTIKHKNIETKAAGIFHLTDTHFNELVSLPVNKYDFNIASKRCKLFVDEARRYFKMKNVKNVLFAITGDLLNSDRRLDELLNEATNRSKATFLAVQLIEYMLLDLNKDFNLTVANVTGNESRIGKDISWSNILATDNYDFTIFNMLDYLFKNSKGITFVTNVDPLEQVVKVANKNILLIHGNQISNKNMEQSIAKLRGKYAARNIVVDFVISAHCHSCRVGDVYARGSSLVGANAYSDRALQLTSRASQNIHIIYKTDRIDSIKIDLQDTTNIKGYNIQKLLDVYHAKSSDKVEKQETIFKVVI